MPDLKDDLELLDIAEQAGFSQDPGSPEYVELGNFFDRNCELLKNKIPNLVKMLAELQKRNKIVNRCYFWLQGCIMHYYLAQGTNKNLCCPKKPVVL